MLSIIVCKAEPIALASRWNVTVWSRFAGFIETLVEMIVALFCFVFTLLASLIPEATGKVVFSQFRKRNYEQETTTRTATRTLPIKDLVHKTIAAHVRYKSLYISYSSFAKINTKMKWATSTLSKKRERRLLIFRFSVWNWIRAIGVLNRYRQLRISLGKCSFLTRCRPRRYRRRCLSSLMFKSMLFFCPPCFFIVVFTV